MRSYAHSCTYENEMSTYINEGGIDELSLMVHIILQGTEGYAIVVV